MADWDEAFGELWTSTVEDLRIQLGAHRVVLTVKLVERDIASWYEIQFEGVSRLVFADEKLASWQNVWIAEAGQRPEGHKTLYSFDLASIDDSLQIVCNKATVVWLATEEQD